MKVKIGNRVYDSSKEPIMLILTTQNKRDISGMATLSKYCEFPEKGHSQEDIKKFMKEGEDEI